MDPIYVAAKKAGEESNTLLQSSSVESLAVSFALLAATYVYRRITDRTPKPIADIEGDIHYDDKTRYDRLCILRRALPDTEKIPEQWVLDAENRPTYEASFSENATQLKMHINQIRACDYPQKLIAIGLISKIEAIFETFLYRKSTVRQLLVPWKEYRNDGFEAMFFSDLALWISVDLPRYDVKKRKTALLVEAWINYCTLVENEVLCFRGDHESARNPITCLQQIIVELKVLHVNIKTANKASNFNDKIQSIRDSMLDMAKNTFDFLNLLIKDVEYREIQVQDLLQQNEYRLNPADHPGVIADSKTQKRLKYIQMQWVIESIKLLGIHSNSFVSQSPINICLMSGSDIHFMHQNEARGLNISHAYLWDGARLFYLHSNDNHEQIPLHNDEAFIRHLNEIKLESTSSCLYLTSDQIEQLITQNSGHTPQHEHLWTDFSKITHLKNTGLWGFARKDIDGAPMSEKAIHYLKKIKKIHHKLIKHYFTIESIVIGCLVSKNIGNFQIYGQEEGQHIIRDLMNIITHNCVDLQSTIDDFWQQFYTEDFAYYKRAKRGVDNRTPCRKWMDENNKVVGNISRAHQDITDLLDAVKAEATSYIMEALYVEEHILALKRNFHAYGRITNIPINSSLKSTSLVGSRIKMVPVKSYIFAGNSLNSVAVTPIGYKREVFPKAFAANNTLHTKATEMTIHDGMDPEVKELILSIQNTTLINQPAEFYSDVQEGIYYNFLCPNSFVVNSLPRGLSIFQNIWPSQIESFVHLYGLINAVMRSLYTGPLDLTPMEVVLIDTFLQRTLQSAFKEHAYYPLTVAWLKVYIYATVVDQEIRISLNDFWLEIAQKSSFQDFVVLTQELNDSQEEISMLTMERDEYKTEAMQKEAELMSTQQQLEDTKDELKDTKDELKDTKDELKDKTDELKDTKDELKDKTDELKDTKDELKDKTDETAELARVIAEQEKIIKELQKTLTKPNEQTSAQDTHNGKTSSSKKKSLGLFGDFFRVEKATSHSTINTRNQPHDLGSR